MMLIDVFGQHWVAVVLSGHCGRKRENGNECAIQSKNILPSN